MASRRRQKPRSNVRIASKNQTKQLIENAKLLIKDPLILLPHTDDSYAEKQLKKIQKQIQAAHKYKDQTDKLEKLASKKGLTAAVAGTLLLSQNENIPYLGVVETPQGPITYAQRGTTNKTLLIATQHPTNPTLRLLILKELAEKKQLHLYSWDNGYYCSGKTSNPPDEFIEFLIDRLNLHKKENNTYYCTHLQKDPTQPHLNITWTNPQITIQTCNDCTNKNTIQFMRNYLIEPDFQSHLDITVSTKLDEISPMEDTLNHYLKGKITDKGLIEATKQHHHKTLKDSDEQTLIHNGKNYHSDIKAFLQSLQPKDFEEKALEYILTNSQDSIIEKNLTANQLLQRYWKKHGLNYLKTMLDDEETAKEFFAQSQPPTTILSELETYLGHKEILKEIPHYSKLPPITSYADTIARTYKLYGAKKTLTRIDDHPNSTKARSIAYAFLLYLKRGKDQQWKYTGEEVEYGTYLKSYAESLLESTPDTYHESLTELIKQTGCNETIPQPQ